MPRDEALHEEYEAGWSLTDIFPVNSVGIVTARDKLTIQWTAEDMERVVADFAARGTEDARSFYDLGKDAQDWKVELAQEDVRRENGLVCPVLYRPFDRRVTYYTGNSRGFICRPRPNVMRHMLAGENVGLSTTRSKELVGGWEHIFASKHLIQHHTVSLKEVNYLFPLYAYSLEALAQSSTGREPNLDREFVEAIVSAIRFDFISDGVGNLGTTFGPEDVFNYVYAVLHSPEYRRRYADFLKSDFPRVPLPGDRALFTDLVCHGGRLVSLHLMEAESTDVQATFPDAGSNQVDKVRYARPKNGVPGRVWINCEQYFECVEPEIWAFTIGGYRPAEKWLKGRKGRRLSEDDIDHYRKIISALAETRHLMAEIDQAIEQHGGWPDAFQPGTAEM